MASIKRTGITDKGKDLITREIAGITELIFTKISVSSNKLADTVNLETLINIDEVKQTVNVSKVEKIGTSQIKVTATFNNSGLMNGYGMETLGIYAKDTAGTEVLFAVTVAGTSDYMPATNGINLSTVTVELIFNLSNTDNVSLSVDTAALVTVGMLKNYYATEQKHGIAKIYSESEAENDSEKVKSVIEAGNGEEREFIREDPNGGAIYGDSPWEKLMKVLDHTKILTVNGLVKILRKIIKPATDNQYGLTTNNNIKNLIKTHAPKPDLNPYIPFSKGYRNTNNSDFVLRGNSTDCWAPRHLYMYLENGDYMGCFHVNGGRAYYKVPNRNGDNWCEIMDNLDMAARDNNIQHAHNRITETWNYAVNANGRFNWSNVYNSNNYIAPGGSIEAVPANWNEIVIYYRVGSDSMRGTVTFVKGGHAFVHNNGGLHIELRGTVLYSVGASTGTVMQLWVRV